MVPVAWAAIQQSQSIHVARNYTPPVQHSPSTSTSEASASTLDSPIVKFSLWFPNGSAYVINQESVPSIFGATNFDINGVPVNVQNGLGAPPSGYVSGVIVVRNDGNVPIIVNATLANVDVPSDIVLTSTCNSINPIPWGTQLSGWMGYSNLSTASTVGVGQYAWLSVSVIMTSNAPGGAVVNHAAFAYSFDVVVSATRA